MVPVVGRTQWGKVYRGPQLSDVLKCSDIANETDDGYDGIPEFDIDVNMDREYDGIGLKVVCSLDEDEWSWKDLALDAKRSLAYQFEGDRIKSLVYPLIGMVHSLEACFDLRHKEATTVDVANFWESWEVLAFLAELCGTRLAKDTLTRA